MIKLIRKIDDFPRFTFTLLIIFFWIKNILFQYFIVAISYIPIVGTITPKLGDFITFILVLMSLPWIFMNITKSDISTYLIMLFFPLVYSVLQIGKTDMFLISLAKYCIQIVPLFFIGICSFRLIDKCFLEKLYPFSLFSMFSLIIISMIKGVGIEAEWASNQYIAYAIVPHIFLFLTILPKKPKLSIWIITIISCVYLVLLGNRGSVFCVLVFLIFLIIQKLGKIRKWYSYITIFCILVLGISIFFGSYELITMKLTQFAQQKGFSTRIIQMILTGEFDDSGRSKIQEVILKRIAEHPFGSGPYSSYFYTKTYSHNLALDLLLDYGIIFGVAFILILFYLGSRAIWILQSQYYKLNVFFGVFCLSIVKLQISSIYLFEPYLFLFIGFCVSVIRTKRMSILSKY